MHKHKKGSDIYVNVIIHTLQHAIVIIYLAKINF